MQDYQVTLRGVDDGRGISIISDFDIADIRAEFPLLTQEIHGHSVVYLDNAATTQMPEVVMSAFLSHYSQDNANVHRGIHTLSEWSTSAYEAARKKVQAFIGARIPEEIIFTSGTISSINLVAQLMEQRLDSNQVVVSTMLEHHANFVPWQQLCLRRGASFVACGLTPEGDIDLDELDRVLSSSSVAIVAVAHDYIRNIGREQISERERMLTHHSRELLSAIDGLHIIGSPVQSCGCCSFMIDNVHPFDLASFIDKLGYALRSGNQCAQPLLHEFYGISNVCRLSPAFYNTEKEIVNCCLAIEKISGFLRKMVRWLFQRLHLLLW